MSGATEDIRPHVDNTGVPNCSEECPSHDGKRCRLTGFRPDRICEPAVIAMARRCRELEDALQTALVEWSATLQLARTDDVDADTYDFDRKTIFRLSVLSRGEKP